MHNYKFKNSGWKINFCHADDCDPEDEDVDVWAADPNLTGNLFILALACRGDTQLTQLKAKLNVRRI